MSVLWIEERIKIGQKTKEFKYYTLQEHQRTRSNAQEYKDSDMFQSFWNQFYNKFLKNFLIDSHYKTDFRNFGYCRI